MTKVAKIEQPETLLPADPMVSMIERIAMDPNLPLDRLTEANGYARAPNELKKRSRYSTNRFPQLWLKCQTFASDRGKQAPENEIFNA